MEIDLPESKALGAEFMRWEIATAIAGALLDINPFDQPDVQQAKDATNGLLLEFKTKGRLPVAAADRTVNGVALTLSSAARAVLPADGAEAVLTLLRPGDYFALLAYLGPDPALAAALQTLRREVRDRARGDDVRLRSALPALDRSAAQRRTEQRRLRAHLRDAWRGYRRFPVSRSRFAHARAGTGDRRFRIARRGRPPRHPRALAVAGSALIRSLADALLAHLKAFGSSQTEA